MRLFKAMLAGVGVFGLAACSTTIAEQPQPEVSTVAAPSTVYVSAHDFDVTLTNLKQAINKRGLNIFSEIDHTAGAASVELDLPNVRLVQFGNPKVGTLLMQKNIELGLALPMKALVYEDAGSVKLKTTNIVMLAMAHGLPTDKPPVSNVAGVLEAIAIEATQ